MLKNLDIYGWNEYFEAYFSEYSSNNASRYRGEDGGGHDIYSPARVAVEHRNYYELYSKFGRLIADKRGKLFYNSNSSEDLPAVGDWVVIKDISNEKKAFIHAVLPRRTKFSRKKAGVVTEEQIIAANIDTVFILSSLNQEFNLRRIERYLTLAWDNNVKPVIVLTKADLCDDMYEKLVVVQNNFDATDAHVISALKGAGMENIYQYFEGNKTIAVLGSSGVGKSTLINILLKRQKMRISEIGLYKDKGKHTTTHRELALVPGGGLIIDTPGMREIQLWEGSQGISELFEDIENLALKCKFTDCKHESEPGCAVKDALEKGAITKDRFKSYKKLLNEIGYFERKQDIKAKLNEKRKWKKISSNAKKISKLKYGE